VTPRTLLTAALVALAALIGAPVAGAAAWQGATPISDPATTVGATPTISLGAAGDAAAIWWDDTAGGRLVVARRPSGGVWSAPVAVASSAVPVNGQIGVDGAGTITAMWTIPGPATQLLTWARAAAVPTVQTVPVGTPDADDNVPDGTLPGEVMSVYSLDVNANGDAVVAGTGVTNAPTRVILGYRRGATGVFVFSFKAGLTFNTPVVAINGAGAAAVVFHSSNSALWGSRHPAGVGVWGSTDVILTAPSSTGAGVSLAIDAAGTAFTAFLTGVTPNFTVATALSPPTGGWQPSAALSAAGVAENSVNVDVAPSGAALLTWQQGTGLAATIEARAGSTLTGTWAAAQSINDAGSLTPAAAIGNDGSAVVTWQRISGVSASGQARVRAADGSWGTTTTILPVHSGSTTPSIATDGVGDFATIATGSDSTQTVMLAVYDAAPPVVSEIGLSGSPLAGAALGLGVTATDAWSAIPAPAWSFGDGASGSGLSVSHAYAAAGTYTSSVTVTDASGNAVTRQLTNTIGALQSTLTSARFSAKWSASRVKGTLAVTGTAPRAGGYSVDVFSGKVRKLHAAYTLTAGAFSKALTLPARLLPGSYDVTLTPAFAANVVAPASGTAKLAAPAEGVVDRVVISGRNGGPSARTLKRATTIWASFHFAAVPKGTLKLTWYKTVKGKRVRLGATGKSPGKKVGSYLRLGGTLHGTFTAVLSRKGKVIAQGSVKAT
jgi:hypothetical protein